MNVMNRNKNRKSLFTKTTMQVPKFSFLNDYTPEDMLKHDREIELQEQQQQKEIRDMAYKGCGIGEDMYQATFKNYNHKTEEQQKALGYVLEYFKRIKSNTFSVLVLYGKPGCGKTHLASALLNAYMHEVKKYFDSYPSFFSGQYITSQELSSRILSTYNFSNKQTFEGIVNEMCLYDLLVIDEVGRDISAIKGEQSGLFAVLDKRKSLGKPIVFCTNCSWDEFSNILGSAAMSRISQNCIPVDMSKIPDYRTKHGM